MEAVNYFCEEGCGRTIPCEECGKVLDVRDEVEEENGEIAQTVEHDSEEVGVGSSTLPLTTSFGGMR